MTSLTIEFSNILEPAATTRAKFNKYQCLLKAGLDLFKLSKPDLPNDFGNYRKKSLTHSPLNQQNLQE